MDEEQETQEEQESRPGLISRLGGFINGVAAPSQESEGDKAESLDDLFEVPQEEDNDIRTDDLLELDEEDIMGGDVNDVLEVSQADIVNGSQKPKAKSKVRRVFIHPNVSQVSGLR